MSTYNVYLVVGLVAALCALLVGCLLSRRYRMPHFILFSFMTFFGPSWPLGQLFFWAMTWYLIAVEHPEPHRR